MSKAYDMISASLNEIIKDVELTKGANLKTTTLTIDVDNVKSFTPNGRCEIFSVNSDLL